MARTKNRMLTALLDEYRRSAIDLKIVLEMLSQDEYDLIRDPETKDPDCKSVNTIAVHVISSGYTYANYLSSAKGGEWREYDKQVNTPQMAIHEIDQMLDHTEAVLETLWYSSQEDIESWSFDSRWKVTYDTEQILEHAIVHILRHRRQIEHFLQM